MTALDYANALSPILYKPDTGHLGHSPFGSAEAALMVDRLGFRHVRPNDLPSILGRPSWEPPIYRTEAFLIDPLETAEDYGTAVGDAAGIITRVTYFPFAAITGAATNSRTLALESIEGETTFASLLLDAGVNADALEPLEIPISESALAAGDGLQWTSTAAGTGLADPGGLVLLTVNGPVA